MKLYTLICWNKETGYSYEIPFLSREQSDMIQDMVKEQNPDMEIFLGVEESFFNKLSCDVSPKK